MTDTHFNIPKTRKEAQDNNSKFFLSDSICKRKHESIRYTNSNSCVECQKLRSQKAQRRRKKWTARKKIEARFGRKLSISEINSRVAFYERQKLIQKATPKWVNKIEIQNIYGNCPKGYHVDHIVPLKGKFVCGLHVENNLQYLPAIENIAKGNRF
jgi:hypothetical protein